MEQPLALPIPQLIEAPVACGAAFAASGGAADREEAAAAAATSAHAVTRPVHKLLPGHLASAAHDSSAAPNPIHSLAASSTVVVARCASRGPTHGSSSSSVNRSGRWLSRSSSPVQTTSTSAVMVPPGGRIDCEVAASALYTGEDSGSTACLCEDEEACRGCRASHRCIDLFSSPSPSPASSVGATAACARGPPPHPFPAVGAELANVGGSSGSRAASLVDAAAAPLLAPVSPSSAMGLSKGTAEAPLSDELAAIAVTGRECHDPHVAAPAAVHDDAITATGASRGVAPSSPLTRRMGSQLLDDGTYDAQRLQTNLEEDGGRPETAKGVSLLELLTRASSTREGLGAVSAGEAASPHPDMDTCAQVEGSAALSQALDAPLHDLLSTIHSPKTEDFSRDGAARAAHVEGVDAGEQTQTPAFCALSLPRGLAGDDAAPRARHSELWKPTVLRSRSRSSTATALVSSQRTVQDIDSDDRDAPSLILHGLVASRVPRRGVRLRGRSAASSGAPAASMYSTPLLPLSESGSGGSGELFSTQLPAEPSGGALSTSIDAVVAAAASARAHSGSVTRDTPLLDSLRVAFSPCPSRIAPCFSLVPCPATSRVSSWVSASARIVPQQWRDHVQARMRAAVGSESRASPATKAALALHAAGGRVWSCQQPLHTAQAGGNSHNVSVARGSAWDAASEAPLQDWQPLQSRRSDCGGAANVAVAPLSLSASSLRAAADLSEGVPEVRRGQVSPPQHEVLAHAGSNAGGAPAATLPLDVAVPRPNPAFGDTTPSPVLQLRQPPGRARNSPDLVGNAAWSLPQASPAAQAPSPSPPPRQAEPHCLLCPKHSQDDGTGGRGASLRLPRPLSAPEPLFAAFVPWAAVERSGGRAGVDSSAAAVTTRRCGAMCTSPSMITRAAARVHRTSSSALSRAAHWPASYTPLRSAARARLAQAGGEDACGGTLWSPASVTTAHRHEGGIPHSPAKPSVYSPGAQPSCSSSLSHRRLLPSTVVNSFESPPASPRKCLRHCRSAQFESRWTSAEGAPARGLSPLNMDFHADAAGCWALDEVSETASALLAGACGEGPVSSCSTPPPRPPFPLSSQHAPACGAPFREEGACPWNTALTSAGSTLQASPTLPHGGPSAAPAKAVMTPLWAPSRGASPVAVAAASGLGSQCGAKPTCRRMRRSPCSAAFDEAPADGDGHVHFGVESELCRLQRAPNVFAPSPSSLSSTLPAFAEGAARALQQPAPSALHIDSESGRAGSSEAGRCSVYVASTLLLAPPPPLLVERSADRFSSAKASPLGHVSVPPAAATGAAAARATASAPHSSSLRYAREANTSLAAMMAVREDLGDADGIFAPIERGDTQTGVSGALDTAKDAAAAAAEGASARRSAALPAASPATQFQYAFSSLRGCRNRQEDSVMIVTELPVRFCGDATAASSAFAGHAAPASSWECSGASAQCGAAATDKDAGPAETTDSTAAKAVRDATTREITSEPCEVVFSCFGVFDGHCGDTVASLASQLFPEHFEHALQTHPSLSELNQRESRGAPHRTGSSAEASLAEEECGHDENPPAEAVVLQRIVSAALVQALVHLDLTLFDVLHDAKQGSSAHCRDGGSTATVAALFKSPASAASCDSDTRSVVGGCKSGNRLSATGDGSVPFASGDSAVYSTSAPFDRPWEQEERDKATAPPPRAARAEETYRLCIANLGDSRAVIGNLQTGELLLSTTDHRAAAHPSEAARIRAAGGVVEFGRVDGTLDVTRGLGDYRYKVAPAQWWASAPAASAPSTAASVSLAASAAATTTPTAAAFTVIGRSSSATAPTTTSPSRAQGVLGSVPPASGPRQSDASEGDAAVRSLRWESNSPTPLRSLVRDIVDDGSAADSTLYSFRRAECAEEGPQPASAPQSKESPPSGAAGRWLDARTAPEQPPQPALLPNPSPPILPSPLSLGSPLASTSAGMLTDNAVSNIADVYEWEVGRGEVLIMASDGVWDRMSSEDVLTFVRHELAMATEPAHAAATRMMRSDDTRVEAASGVGIETGKSPRLDRVDAEERRAADGPSLSLGEVIGSTPLRHSSRSLERKSTSARHHPAALLCTPGGNGSAACGQDEGAAHSLVGTTGGSPCFFAVQAAARRLTEHVVHSLRSSDNTTVVIVVFG
ncbi:hypothetical protein LSCM1_07999 [Leishmania martiniquensis]|uniref:protein-serine/threonine phosphatase n=1 Tax=Leishmania martiniquensis TaxID=1580590 RepID=A0A836L2V9_9TRYP|nr:hypothetical protein LSCM1_07999 [Leishmania martiniquensis]